MSPLAVELLHRLGESEVAEQIEIGGGICLWQYSPHRGTNDIDAWWAEESAACREAIQAAVATVAGRHGLQVSHRAQAGYESWDLKRDNKTVFAFQIARKSRRLEESTHSPWGKLRLETLRENISNKMTALVQRGAPRDFADIAAVLDARLLSERECWTLWQQRNPEFTTAAAQANLLKYLNALQARRPLEKISDQPERERARLTRERMRAFADEAVK